MVIKTGSAVKPCSFRSVLRSAHQPVCYLTEKRCKSLRKFSVRQGKEQSLKICASTAFTLCLFPVVVGIFLTISPDILLPDKRAGLFIRSEVLYRIGYFRNCDIIVV